MVLQQMKTDENGLYYMRVRYYNSDIKRFINQDIKVGDIGSSQSLNRVFCKDNLDNVAKAKWTKLQNRKNGGYTPKPL